MGRAAFLHQRHYGAGAATRAAAARRQCSATALDDGENTISIWLSHEAWGRVDRQVNETGCRPRLAHSVNGLLTAVGRPVLDVVGVHLYAGHGRDLDSAPRRPVQLAQGDASTIEGHDGSTV